MKITKKTLYRLCIFTLVGFSLLGILIIWFWIDKNWWSYLTAGEAIPLQLLKGTGFGIFSALWALALIQTNIMQKVTGHFADMFDGLNLNIWDILFFSFCAGVGEEIFFRGALQPFGGVWLVAIFFVVLHGYINPKSWRTSIYGLILILIVAGMGYLAISVGLISAMAAHMAFDVIMFYYIMNEEKFSFLK